VTVAVSRVASFVRRKGREVASLVFLVVLALVVASTGASLLATTALGLITFVPLFGRRGAAAAAAGVADARRGVRSTST
jgi:hypothetical protein